MSEYYKGEPKINYSIKIDGTFLSGTKRDVIKVGNYLEAKDNRIAELEEGLRLSLNFDDYSKEGNALRAEIQKLLNENTEKE